MRLVTKRMVLEAIDLALPTVRVLCAKYTWGPKGVVIAVSHLSLTQPYVYVMDELGPRESWQDTDGTPLDFQAIALRKLRVSSRTGHTSHDVITNKPWLLEGGDSLYRGAVAEDDGLAVAASGSHAEIDEMVSWTVFNLIAALCHMKIREIRRTGVNQI